MIRLTVTREDGRQATYEFDRDEVLIGRAPPADIILDHDAVSRRHARISLKSQGWRVADLGAANGVFLQRRGEPPAQRVIVEQVDTGDVICIERFRIRFELFADQKARWDGLVEGEEQQPRATAGPTQLLSLTALNAQLEARRSERESGSSAGDRLDAQLALSMGDPVGSRARTDVKPPPELRRELELREAGATDARKLPISVAPIQFGSDPSCDVVIKGLTVPRFLASLELDGERALLRRVGGGFMGPRITVNGEPFREEAHLTDGQRFSVGPVSAVVRLPKG
ncbi:MAG: FHA domain-containing protein [Myxococcota bacterium]